MSVELRRASLDDYERLYRWRKDSSQYFFSPPPAPEEHSRWLQNNYQDNTQHIFIILAPNPVGTISLYHVDRLHRRAEYGRFIVERDSRGKGYGRAALGLVLQYAFAALDLNRVYGEILYDNQAGLAIAHGCGFHPEGIFWEHVCKDGIYRDVVRMALLRDEWYIRQEAGL